jgi:Fe2+ transport system protein FeoA
VLEEIPVAAPKMTNEAESPAREIPTPCVVCDAPCEHYSLDKARSGDELEIVQVDDEHARVQCLRFGMAEGACVTCVTKIPAGPLVLKSGRQEIAVGRGLAKRIRVRDRQPDPV